MVIFHSYVSLPEGITILFFLQIVTWGTVSPLLRYSQIDIRCNWEPLGTWNANSIIAGAFDWQERIGGFGMLRVWWKPWAKTRSHGTMNGHSTNEKNWDPIDVNSFPHSRLYNYILDLCFVWTLDDFDPRRRSHTMWGPPVMLVGL